MPKHGKRKMSEGQQEQTLIGEETNQQICRQQHRDKVEASPTGIAAGKRLRRDSTFPQLQGQMQQVTDIAPAKIQALATHWMAAMTRFSHQKQRSAMETGRQAQLQRERAGIIEQFNGVHPFRKDGVKR
jgi:hypothetical protein